MPAKIVDMVGKKFSRLLVVKEIPGNEPNWECLCDCGNTINVKGRLLRSGNTKSCGCLRLERLRSKLVTHGGSGTPEYRSWKSMINRCTDPDHHKFHLYGARGITVCSRWMNFNHFYADMGPKPSQKHSIERKNGNVGYEPDNCEWATYTVQNNNRSVVRKIAYNGENLTIRDIIDRLGSVVDHRTVSKRVFRDGWSIEDALTTPLVETKGITRSSDARAKMRAAKNRTAKRFSYQGEILTVSEIVERFGSVVRAKDAYKRIQRGWTIDEAITTPLKDPNVYHERRKRP